MLFTLKQQVRVAALEKALAQQTILVEELTERVDKMRQHLLQKYTEEMDAKYGLKVDGTPKAKPGRKAKDERIS
jgi:uncharacterized coiled-coil protein SlyX